MYNYNYTRFNFQAVPSPLSYRFIFPSARVPVPRYPPTQLTFNRAFIVLDYTNYYGRGGQMDANECVGDENCSGYLRDTQAGVANSSPTLRICSTGQECGAPLEPWACNDPG